MENKPNKAFLDKPRVMAPNFAKLLEWLEKIIKFNKNFIDVLHIHVVLFWFFSYPKSQNYSDILVSNISE